MFKIIVLQLGFVFMAAGIPAMADQSPKDDSKKAVSAKKQEYDYEKMKKELDEKAVKQRDERLEKLSVEIADAEKLLKEAEDAVAKNMKDAKNLPPTRDKKKLAERDQAKKNFENEVSKAKKTLDRLNATKRSLTPEMFTYIDMRNVNSGDFGRSRPDQAFTVSQFVDKQNLIIKWGNEFFWASVPGGDYVEDKTYNFPGWIHCVGTKSYTTVIGAKKTVSHIILMK